MVEEAIERKEVEEEVAGRREPEQPVESTRAVTTGMTTATKAEKEELTVVPKSPKKQTQDEKEKTAQMTWAEVVKEARQVRCLDDVEAEIAPTQTGDSHEMEGGPQDQGRVEADENNEGTH